MAYHSAEALEKPAAIVAAVLGNRPLTAQTKINYREYEATLIYPIKTINANERDNIYQTDTGPILLPDFSKAPDQFITGFELAFSAFNCPSWIELIVRTKTPLENGIPVYHYSQSVRFEAENSVMG